MKKIFTLLSLALITFNGFSQTTLVAGDIAFIGIHTVSPDHFAFVTLKDLQANTVISFTDNTWLTGGSLATNESIAIWTAPAGGVASGTSIVIVNDTTAGAVDGICTIGTVSGSLSGLSSSGDQIFAFQGQSTSPAFVAGISSTTWLSSCNSTSGGANNNTSCLPYPLVDGGNAVSFSSELDNSYYSGPTTGNLQTILAAINNPNNWTRADASQIWPNWSFSITTAIVNVKNNRNEYFIFPNPTTSGIVNINKESSFVKVIDFTGKQIAVVNKTDKIDVSVLENGIYVLVFDNNQTLRMVVSK